MKMNNDADDTTTTCANCDKGEESTGDLKACTACKMVKYCNRDCQIAHRPQHKKAYVGNVQLNYMMRPCSKTLLLQKIVQYASCVCRRFYPVGGTKPVVGNVSAVDVFMR